MSASSLTASQMQLTRNALAAEILRRQALGHHAVALELGETLRVLYAGTGLEEHYDRLVATLRKNAHAHSGDPLPA